MTSPDKNNLVGELGVTLGVGWIEGQVHVLKKYWVKVLQGSCMRDLIDEEQVPKSSWVFLHVSGYLKGLGRLN